MSERQKQRQFLKVMLDQHPSGECQVIRDKIHRAEREERFLRRMIFLSLVLMLVSMAALGYMTVFWPEVLQRRFQYLLKLSCSLALTSLICLVVFGAYWFWHRGLLNGLYHQCRKRLMSDLGDRPRLH
jgi:ABC-type nickel/cobalt efflux system permease component RcnA